ncbi:MAG: hypothetical protein ACKV2T_07245 [Kofleriaceae bacterium]
MFATAFHEHRSLAILFAVALVLTCRPTVSHDGAAANDPVSVTQDPAPAPVAPLPCTASTSNARRCAHALHVARQPRAAAKLLWSVIYPCCHSGPDWRVHKGVASNRPWGEAFEIRDLASRYERLADELDALRETDPTVAYWHLAVLRKMDLELGGVYAVEIWARLRDIAPRAANHYAKGKTVDDCVSYSEPAAMAKELGIDVDPRAARCSSRTTNPGRRKRHR